MNITPKALVDEAGPYISEVRQALRLAHQHDLQFSSDDLFRLQCRAGRKYAPELLYTAWVLKVISPEVLTASIAGTWSIVEYPHEALARRDWLDLFGAAGFTIDGKPAERPGEAVTLYRGCTSGRRRGFSWSSDRTVAEWFAQRPGSGDAAVYEVDAPPESLLCIPGTEGRPGEAEHVIDTSGLRIRRA